MAAPFYEAWPATRAQFHELDAVTDIELADLCFASDETALRATRNTQPAVFTVGLATYTGMTERYGDPDYVAGHSLGHITAAAAAGMLAPTTGIGFVRKRGELMEAAAHEAGPGTMLAVLFAASDLVADICAEYDDVSIAGFNAPRQTLISGTTDAVDRVTEAITAETRARFIDLDVDAAFHSPVMAPAVVPFTDEVADLPLADADIPIVSDISTTVYTTPETARQDFAAQLTSPIDWVGVIETLQAHGVDRYVEFPPAGTLTELIETIAPETTTVALETPADAQEEFA